MDELAFGESKGHVSVAFAEVDGERRLWICRAVVQVGWGESVPQ
jgi:hypothetical protein